MNNDRYSGVSGTTDFESEVKIFKLQVAVQIWSIGIVKSSLTLMKIDTRGFLRGLISN